jgi:hypothetical protein
VLLVACARAYALCGGMVVCAANERCAAQALQTSVTLQSVRRTEALTLPTNDSSSSHWQPQPVIQEDELILHLEVIGYALFVGSPTDGPYYDICIPDDIRNERVTFTVMLMESSHPSMCSHSMM